MKIGWKLKKSQLMRCPTFSQYLKRPYAHSYLTIAARKSPASNWASPCCLKSVAWFIRSDRLFRRRVDGGTSTFADLFELSQNTGEANFVAGRSCSCVDGNGDGNYGVMVANYGGPMRLFEAEADGRSKWEVLKLQAAARRRKSSVHVKDVESSLLPQQDPSEAMVIR